MYLNRSYDPLDENAEGNILQTCSLIKKKRRTGHYVPKFYGTVYIPCKMHQAIAHFNKFAICSPFKDLIISNEINI